MRNHRHAPVWLLFLLLACPAPLAAADWPQWRGPALNGTSPETALPLHWSHTNGVLWAFPLPGMSGATPAIAGEAVFVVSPNAARELVLFCLDRHTGREKWQRKIAEGDRDKGRNNMASPSPATDGRRVFILFATGDLAAFDAISRIRRARRIPRRSVPRPPGQSRGRRIPRASSRSCAGSASTHARAPFPTTTGTRRAISRCRTRRPS